MDFSMLGGERVVSVGEYGFFCREMGLDVVHKFVEQNFHVVCRFLAQQGVDQFVTNSEQPLVLGVYDGVSSFKGFAPGNLDEAATKSTFISSAKCMTGLASKHPYDSTSRHQCHATESATPIVQ
jgi:hypothetical protein